MLKKVIFMLFICLLVSSFTGLKIKEYINKERPGKNDIVVVAFQHQGGCVKCAYQINEIITKLNQEKPNKIKALALVFCDREIELKAFIKNNNWKYSAYKINFKELQDYGATERTMIRLYNSKSELLLELNYDDENTDLKLKMFLDKSKNSNSY